MSANVRFSRLQGLFAATIIAVSSFVAAPVAIAQTTAPNEWTWMGGSGTVAQPGVYGTMGVPAAGNIPGSRHDAASWTDSSGNFWLFGGNGHDANGTYSILNDLWKFSPSTNQWTGIGGSSTGSSASRVFGLKGTPAAANNPGDRAYATSWADSSGNLWLFGGEGFNDLWMFNPATNQWTWMSGSKLSSQAGIYGTKGVSDAGNAPGGRYYASSWIDGSGHLWLFGGYGYDATKTYGSLNDLWEFDPSTNQWTWISGSNAANQSGVFGTQGTSAAENMPGGKSYASSWIDHSGNLWLFGGSNTGAITGGPNDLWKFNPSTNQWTWMSGSSTSIQYGVYGTMGIPAGSNMPGSRAAALTWTDANGNFWLRGGEGVTGINLYNGYLDDLWELNPVTNVWTWMGGSNTTANTTAVYGEQGTPAAENFPGVRYVASSWIDKSGNLWLFGGIGKGGSTSNCLNDLWVYQPSSAPLPNAMPLVTVTPSSTNLTPTQDLTISVVVGEHGIPIPSGSVVLSNGSSYTSASTTLSDSGSATFNFAAGSLAGGSYTFTASYTPDSVSSSTYNSSTGTATVTVVVPAPTFSLPSGSYSPNQSVTISDAATGATIYYTTDGTTPTTSSSVYSGPITVSSSETLEAMTAYSGYANSAVTTANYLISSLAVGGVLDWTWVGGSSTTLGQAPVYGTLGTPAASNTPGYRSGATSWTDSSGHLWLFGGSNYRNDLWMFDPSTKLWTWISGSGFVSQHGVYGTAGIASSTNIPGSRADASSWIDASGNLWLFGGYGYDSTNTPGYLSDLWEFNPTTKLWTWISGNNTVNQTGVFGTQGTAAAGNMPGGRENASSWIDHSGNLWIFGGQGYTPDTSASGFNDLWKFNPATNLWTWMGGSSTVGVYGTLGINAAGNIPPIRENATSWTDSNGNLWLFGGFGLALGHITGGIPIGTYINDLWMFNTNTNQWAWMGGSNTLTTSTAAIGTYGKLGIPSATNFPGSREYASSWIDINGNLWLFGGDGYAGYASTGELNDLWELNPATNEWTWMGGSNVTNQSGVYGTLGTPAASNIPGGRAGGASWIDGSGNLWLFGGSGYNANGTYGLLSDLWEYQLPTSSPLPNATPLVTVTPSATSFSPTQALTLTVVVGENGSLTPSGSVILSGGGYTSAAATLSGGSATFNVAAGALAGGSYTFTASYTPDSASSSTYNRATGTATITVAVPAPTFSLPSGSYSPSQTVSISDALAGTIIYYTTDGTTPTTSSSVYSGAITISSSETLEAIAAYSGYTNSALATANYLISPLAVGGTMDWTWMSGSNTAGAVGTYGTLGTPAVGNIPGSREYSTSWTDHNGNLWLFGGISGGNLGAVNGRVFNDLWEFNPNTNLWAWMGGSSTQFNQSGVYGTMGTLADGNLPGSRAGATSWIDNSGNLWLFGGDGDDASGEFSYLNDLWKFSPSTNQWTWIGGSNTTMAAQFGVYGTQGIPASGNIPGSRFFASSWTDANGNFWIFGGYGSTTSGRDLLNELWMFNPSTNLWVWMGGKSTTGSQSGVYGTKGTPAVGNMPGGRDFASSWIDYSGNLWLFGGYGYDATGVLGCLNDLWEFNPSTNQWTWMGGGNTVKQPGGVYGTQGIPAAGNMPGSREPAASWTDASGNLWLFGGYGYDATGVYGRLNDLWEFNPSTNQWTWMSGSNTGNQSGVYGTLGTPSAGNIPGPRSFASSWSDNSGNLWLFGGVGYDATKTSGYLNDLWKYQLPTTIPTVTVTPSLTSFPITQGLTVTVTVSAGNNNRTPTGSAVLTGTGGFAASATALSGGIATISIPAGMLAAGSNTFTASYTPDSSSTSIYSSAIGTSAAVTVSLIAPTITFAVPNHTYGDAAFTVAATSNSTGAITYAVVSGPATISGSTVTLTGAGSVVLRASQTAAGNYAASTQDVTFPVATAAPTISFAVANHTYGDAVFTVAATSNSTGAITYSVVSGPATVSGSTVTLTGAGSVVLRASQAAAGNYAASTQDVTFTVATAAPTISFAVANHTYGDAVFTVAATSNSTGAITYAVVSGPATISGSTVTLTGAGSVVLRASQAAAGNYAASTQDVTFTVATAAPTISFAVANHTYGDAAFTVAATSNSTGAITYSVVSGPATISGSTVTLTGAGSVVLRASQAAAGNYAASTQDVTFTVATESQSITFAAPTSPVTYGVSPITLSASSTSGLAVTFSVVSGPGTISGNALTVTGVGTIVVAADQAGNSNYKAADRATQSIVVNVIGAAATPMFSPASGTFTATQSVSISDTTSGAIIYYTTDGTTPTTSSTRYTSAISVSSTETLEAIAVANGYSNSAVATASYTKVNPSPAISSLSPALTNAGSTAFTLTINGTGFITSSTAYWGTTALATQYVSATQLIAQVTAAEIANAGTITITVQTPTPGGGSSSALQFEIDSTGSGSTAPTITVQTAITTAGSPANYPVTVPATVTSVSVTCLNLPAGASCSYSPTTGTVTIATSSSTPAGTYQITIVFTETVTGASTAGIFLPILLLPLMFARKRLRARGIWVTACLGLLLVTAAATMIGCGGGSNSTPPAETHQVIKSGVVSLTIQ